MHSYLASLARFVALALAVSTLQACEGRITMPGDDDAARRDGSTTCRTDAECSDDTFCNGVEICDADDADADDMGCVASSSPCLTGQTCMESMDRCVTDCGTGRDADGDGVDSVDCAGTDCDDSDVEAFPGAFEICDEDDEDCDPTSYGTLDADGDGRIASSCCNLDEGVPVCGDDCNDTMISVHPGSTEACNDVDDDCDGSTDETVQRTFYEDGDGDGVGRGDGMTRMACLPPAGFAESSTDCDDMMRAVSPAAAERCNMLDDDCDMMTDEGATRAFWPDADGDSFGDRNMPMTTCGRAGLVENGSDCNDADMGVRPGGIESCDGTIDHDCDSIVDEGCGCSVGTMGACGSDVGACRAGMRTCMAGGVWGSCEGSLGPASRDSCGGVGEGADEDCDGLADELPEAAAGCAIATNATPTCRGGFCTYDCLGGFGDCDIDRGNGCETNVTTTAAHCGACGAPCLGAPPGADPVCSGAICGYACRAPFVRSGAECLDPTLRAPRPVTPMSGSVATSRRPTLQWELFDGADAASAQVCRDRDCTSVVGEWVIAGGFGQIGANLAPGLYFWRLRGRRAGVLGTTYSTRVWQLRVYIQSDLAGSGGGTRWGAELDLRGDGFADIAIGRNTSDVFYTYLGAATGLSPSEVGTSGSPDGGAGRYGYSVASAGDVNGDGFGDMIAGACGPGATPPGPDAGSCANRIYLFHGAAGGSFYAGSIAGPGGITGFGVSVASAGDVNADGYGDVVVGAYGSDRAYVYLGSPSGVSSTVHATLVGDVAGSLYGLSVASIGDYDADNDADIVIGAPLANGAGSTNAYIYCGNAGGMGDTPAPCGRIDGPDGWNLGISVAAAGDLNNDGVPDLVLGGNGNATLGVVRAYPGVFGGITTVHTTEFVGVAGSAFGVSVTGTGDVEGDGFCDIAIGSANREVTVIYGSSGGVRTVLTGVSAFGRYVTGIGDVNGDARGDLLVTACNPTGTCDNAAFVYHGAPGMIGTTPAWSRSHPDGGFGLGASR